jgi:putative tryptophan/tyrosine transport system substrate-binding protein
MGSALLFPLATNAQRQTLIAIVSSGQAAQAREREENLAQGLRELGHTPGRSFRLEQRVWNADPKTIGPLLRDVLAAKPDVLVVGGLGVVQAAKQATSSTPIVVTNASDLVSSGIVKSYARPGGNITGFTTLTDVLTGKRLEVVVEAVPTARRVVLLQNPLQPQTKSTEAHTRNVAAKLRVELPVVNAVDQRELEAALDKLGEIRADGVLLASHALFRQHSAMLIERALKHKAFVVHWLPYAAQQGALVVMGFDEAKLYKRAAAYVDRILKGARPGDLPIEQVTSDELIINLKTARALGLKVSQAVLLRSSRVIQ